MLATLLEECQRISSSIKRLVGSLREGKVGVRGGEGGGGGGWGVGGTHVHIFCSKHKLCFS